MEEVFKKWHELQLKHSILQTNDATIIFYYIVSQYYKQGEEKENGFTKINCIELFNNLGLGNENVYGATYLYGEDYYNCFTLQVLDILDKNNVLFYLLEPFITRPFYTVSFSPVIDGLMDFKYDVIKDENE